MTKKMYKVTFEFRNRLGEWETDYFSNNDNGFTLEDAEYIAYRLRQQGERNVIIEEN